MWDLSLEEDRAKLRRVQNREQPELLAGCPPSDDFFFVEHACRTRNQQIEKQRELSHRSELVYKATGWRWMENAKTLRL